MTRIVTVLAIALWLPSLSAHAQSFPNASDVLIYEAIYPGLPASEVIRQAVSGNVLAQHELSNRFAQGNGVPRNISAAAQWYSLATSRGFPGSPSLDVLPTVPILARSAGSESVASPPTASLTITAANDGLTTTLDASASAAATSIQSYIWSIENADGSRADITVADSELTQVTFTEPGIYYVTLSILDDTGRIDHITEKLDLSEPPDLDTPEFLVYDGDLESGEVLGQIECVVIDDTDQDFGDVTDDDWRQWFNSYDFSLGPEDLATGVDGFRAYLRQRLIPTSIGSPRVLARRSLNSARTYRLTQSLYFEPGFDWGGSNEGGKVGFGFGGGTTPSGGQLQTDGFTLRLMWRGNRDGTARMVAYSYAADRDQGLPWGDNLPFQGFQIPIGEWFDITLEVKTNSTTDASDGTLRGWVNEELVLQRDNIGWQLSGDQPAVQKLSYATFYGGNDPSWAPSETTYVRFANACWAPVIDFSNALLANSFSIADSSLSQAVLFDDAVLTVRGQLNSALSDVEILLPSESMSVNTQIYSALDDINAALAGSRWSDNVSIPLGSPVIDNLRGAAETLSMVSVDAQAVAYVQEQTEANAQVLINAARTLTSTARLQVRNASFTGQCNTTPGAARCSTVDFQLLGAERALEQSSAPGLATSEQSRLISLAWGQVNAAARL